MLSEIEGLEIVGVAPDGIDARDRVVVLKPDVLTLDIRMPLRSGIDVLCDIKKSAPTTKIIILTNYP